MCDRIHPVRTELSRQVVPTPSLIRIFVVALFMLPCTAFANTDVVIFNNGDRLTGEVKSLERGRLRFKTDATDTINIEWDEVAYLSSDQNIQVETVLGQRFLGHLVRTEDKNTLVVQSSAGPINFNNTQVVKMTPIEEKAINRLDGDVTLGYNFAKANEVLQVNFGLDLNYRTEARILSLSADATLTDSQDNDANQRETLSLDYRRLLKDRWLAGGGLNFERNDELRLDLRTSVNATGGRILRQTDHSSLILEGGLMGTREELAGDPDAIPPIVPSNEETIESFATVKWDWYRYDAPELDLSTSLQVITNLSDTGRVRGELDVSLKWEMIEDLFWQLSYYHSYDNRSPTSGLAESDYGIVTSLGYSF